MNLVSLLPGSIDSLNVVKFKSCLFDRFSIACEHLHSRGSCLNQLQESIPLNFAFLRFPFSMLRSLHFVTSENDANTIKQPSKKQKMEKVSILQRKKFGRIDSWSLPDLQCSAFHISINCARKHFWLRVIWVSKYFDGNQVYLCKETTCMKLYMYIGVYGHIIFLITTFGQMTRSGCWRIEVPVQEDDGMENLPLQSPVWLFAQRKDPVGHIDHQVR